MRFFRRRDPVVRSDMSPGEAREFVWAMRRYESSKKGKAFDKLLGAFGHAFPKGVRHPDKLVTNKHLYVPGVKGPKKTILR